MRSITVRSERLCGSSSWTWLTEQKGGGIGMTDEGEEWIRQDMQREENFKTQDGSQEDTQKTNKSVR